MTEAIRQIYWNVGEGLAPLALYLSAIAAMASTMMLRYEMRRVAPSPANAPYIRSAIAASARMNSGSAAMTLPMR